MCDKRISAENKQLAQVNDTTGSILKRLLKTIYNHDRRNVLLLFYHPCKNGASFSIGYKRPEFLDKLNRNEARLFPQTRIAIELMLLTFVRTAELLEAKWAEFDMKGKTWVIPSERMKMRKAHIVPLSKQVLKLLENLKAANGKYEFILPSQTAPRKPMSNNTILYALYRMGYKGKTTGHGFRALAMTAIKEKLGYRHEVVDRQLAHAHRNSVDAAYDRAQFLDDRKKMMQDWADYIDNLKKNFIFTLDKC